MTNLPRALTMILVCLALGFFLAAWSFKSAGRDSKQQQNGNPARQRDLREIAQSRDVDREVAEGENNSEYEDLQLLAKHSEAIVVGRILSEQSAFSGTDHIVTSYRVDVQRVLKDTTPDVVLNLRLLGEQEPPAPLTTPLRFVREGGVVHVDGHRVSERMRGTEALKAGQNYILFLHWSRSFKAYRLAGGASGAVLIGSDLRIKPLGSKKGVLKHDGTQLEALIAELRAAQ